MRLALLGLAGTAVMASGCTETLVVDATGQEIPAAAIYKSPVGGADGVVSPGEDLRGRVLRVETLTTTNRFVFLDNNVFWIEDESGTRVVQGTYAVRGDGVCVDWAPRGAECWPRMLTATDTPVILTSDRGQAIKASVIDN